MRSRLSDRNPERSARKRYLDTGAFVVTNPADKPITSGLPVNQERLFFLGAPSHPGRRVTMNPQVPFDSSAAISLYYEMLPLELDKLESCVP